MICVLYVDDELNLLQIGKLFLERNGQFTVDTISSASKALPLLGQKNYDAIISDYQMPVMDGIGFLKAVRASGNDIPFILFTGRGREEVVIEAINNGADFYLQKGGDPSAQFAELAHKIRQAVGRKQAERSLKESEKRLADIFNFLPDATCAIDNTGHVIAWNRAIEDMTGVPSAEMLGKGDYEYAIPFYGIRQKTLIDLIFEPDEIITKKYSHIIHQNDILIAETTLPHPKGKEVTLLGKASPLYNQEGTLVGAIESVRDITELRMAEISLRESERRYREVVETQTEFICRFRPDGTHVFVNDAFCRQFGKTRDEIIGHRFVPPIPEEDRGLLRRHFASFSLQHPVADIEHRIIMPDGSIRWQWWNDHAIFDADGNVIEYQSIGKDITDRKRVEEDLKQSENLFRTIFDYTGAASIIIGPDTTILRANDEWVKLTGMPRQEQENRLSWTVFFNKDDVERMKGYHYARRKDPATVPNFYESCLISSSGTVHNVIVHVGMIPGTKNSVASLVDISERRKTEDDLRLAYGNLATAEEQLRAKFEELKEKEQKVRESEQQFRVLAENAPVAIVFIRDRHCVYINEYAAAMSGYSKEELSTKDFWEIIHPDSRDMVRARGLARQRGEEVPSRYEVKYVTKGGEIRWADLSGSRISYQGNPASIAMFMDITDRKRMEGALRTSEAKYRTILESIQECFYRTDEKGTIILTSPSGAILLGYNSPDDLYGKDLAMNLYYNPADRRKFLAEIDKTGSVRNYEVILKKKDGTPVTVLTSSHKYYDPEGRFLGIEGIFRDITDRKKVEEALRVSEERFYKMFQSSADLIALTSIPEGKIIAINDSAARVSGYSPEEAVGKTTDELRFWVDLDAREEYMDRCRREGRIYNFETLFRQKSGRIIPALLSGSAILLESGPAFISVIHDITDRKSAEEALRESEETFRSFVQESSDGIVLIDDEGVVLAWNAALARTSGIPPGEALKKPYLDLIISLMVPEHRTPDRTKRIRTALDEALRTGQSEFFSHPIETEFLRRDGQRRIIQQIIFPIRTTKGFHIGSISRDITEQKAAK